MEAYIPYLFYLAVIFILGILITAATNKFKLSNIIFLVLAGSFLKILNFDFFSDTIVLILSSLALILIILETTLSLDINHILKKFYGMIKFSIAYFLICTYFITLLIFQLFDLPGKGFELFALAFLLSIIVYAADPSIAFEFQKKRKSKIFQMLNIEGIISSPLIVVFSLFLINFLAFPDISFSQGMSYQLLEILKQIFIAVVLGFVLAWSLIGFLSNFKLNRELTSLLIITLGIIAFVFSEVVNVNGSLSVAIFGLILAGYKKSKPIKHTMNIYAHPLYIVFFILFGLKSFFPSPLLWVKGLGLFLVYLMLRFASISIFLKKLKLNQKIFMTFNVAKGIEVAIVLFIMQISLKHIPGIEQIISLGFMFFVLSYLVSTVVNKIPLAGKV
tara:strand:+ start:3904 stop:5070 length:1167 start_codon:yes stop_codon:yes gene_type:complete